MPREATQFKKGNCANPGGRPKLPEAIRKLKTQTQADAEKSLLEMLSMSQADLAAKLADPKTSMNDLIVGSVILKAQKEGDHSRLGFVWDRLFGKVKEVVEQTNLNHDINPDEYREIPREVLLKVASGEKL